MSYTEVTISSYNSNPPTDDGSSDSSNLITWAGVKTKLGDPINTAIASVDDNVASACNSLDTSITAAESSITASSAVIAASASSAGAPSGTQMFFVQTAAPTGWTKITTYNDYAIRLTSGTVSTGGSTAFTSVFASRTITTTQLPSHSHTVAVTNQSVSLNRTTWSTDVNITSTNTFTNGSAKNGFSDIDQSTEALAATVSHSGTTDSTGNDSAMDFAVQYVDVILASKN